MHEIVALKALVLKWQSTADKYRADSENYRSNGPYKGGGKKRQYEVVRDKRDVSRSGNDEGNGNGGGNGNGRNSVGNGHGGGNGDRRGDNGDRKKGYRR